MEKENTANLEAKGTSELESAPLSRLMVKYSLPCIVSLVVSALYNIVDQLFIANASYLGSYGNAANTTVFPLVIVCLAIGGMFGDGTNAYFTFCVGGGRAREGRNAVGTAFTTVLVLGVLFAAGYIVFSTPLLHAFGADVNEQTFANAKEYLFWIALGLPFYMVGQTLAPIICGDGTPRYSMITMLTGCAINIVFDPILIYGAKWGMKGAAIATIAGQIVVCILNVSYLARMKSVRMRAASFKPRLSALKQIVPLGMTSFFAQLSIVLSMAAVNNVVKAYGASDKIFGQEQYAQIPLAVVGLVFKFFQIIVSVAIGLAAGSVPIIGYNRGARRFDRLSELFGRIIKVEVAVGIVAFLVFELAARQITYLFGAAHESIYYQDFAMTCIRIFLSLVILSCANKGIMIFLQGMGKAAQSTTISVLREIVGGVLLPLLLPLLFGFNGILFFMPAAEVLTFIFALIFALKLSGELKAASTGDAGEAQGSLEGEAQEAGEPKTTLVITIGRSYGAGGRTVGKLVASRLGVPYYDAELLERAAEKSGMDKKFLESLDEKPVSSELLYQYVGSMRGSAEPLQSLAAQAQREIIESVASSPCVIVGRRADRILRDKVKTLSVFVTAPASSRGVRVAKREGLSEDQALKLIAKVDKARAAYYNLHADGQWGDAANYDICVDTDKFGEEGAASAVCEAAKLLES